MDAGLIAFSAQRSKFYQLENVANNIANANTNGFKGDLSVFLSQSGNVNGERNPLPKMLTATDNTQGNLRQTQRQLDVAINGNGFFQVETPLGPRFTRAGEFLINDQNTLVNKDGFPVSSDGGNITFEPNDNQIKIGDNGEVTVTLEDGTSVVRGTIGVFKFANIGALQKVGNAYYTGTDPEIAVSQVDYKMAQGMVEDSNVNTIQQMTEMIEISRDVQSVAKIISDQHDMQRNTFTRLTSVQ